MSREPHAGGGAIDPELLTEQLTWIRRLAFELAGDADVAEDLVQETLVVALERPPRSSSSLRAWMRSVLRNLARQRFRREGSRKSREREAAELATGRAHLDLCDASQAATARDAATLTSARVVLDAVEALAEPYRHTVMARYYDGLPPREIARLDGVSVKTVETRLLRAHEKLRRRLDRGGDGRGSWLGALAPLLIERGLAEGPDVALAGGANTAHPAGLRVRSRIYSRVPSWTGAVATVALGGVLAWNWWVRSEAAGAGAGAEETQVASAAASQPAGAELGRMPGVLTANDRAPVELGSPGAAAPPALPQVATVPAPEPLLVRGLVVDPDGLAAFDVEVRACPASSAYTAGASMDRERFGQVEPLDGASVSVRTDREGRFELELEREAFEVAGLFVDARGTERVSWLGAFRQVTERFDDLVLVVAPPAELVGSVSEESGAPADGVELQWSGPPQFEARLGLLLTGKVPAAPSAVTDERGMFQLADLPRLPGAFLTASRPGFRELSVPVPDERHGRVDLVMERLPEARDQVFGTVVDARGTPVEAAWVCLGTRRVRSERDGSFHLPRQAGARVVLAVAEGRLPGSAEVPEEDSAHSLGITLRLGGPTLALRGRLVDPEGAPLPGRRVWIADPTQLRGTAVEAPVCLEHLTEPRGADVWFWAETDATGAFELTGLLDRAYRLRALDMQSLSMSESEPIAPGSSPVLRLDVRSAESLSGRVLGLDRNGLGDVEVSALRKVLEFETPWLPQDWYQAVASESVRTDGEGAFELSGLAPGDFVVHGEGEHVFPGDVPVKILAGTPARTSFALSRRCYLRVDADPTGPDRFATVDASGRERIMLRESGSTGVLHFWGALNNGLSVVTTVNENVVAVVLNLEGEELARVPVRPVPGEIVTVYWP